MSYGMRYLLKMIFNVAVGEDDNDGNQQAQRPAAPEGFVRWLDDLDATADEGTPALRAAWKASSDVNREYLTKYGEGKWEALKAKAAKVQVKA
jgi:hypothetical protein